jgi:hypothetical protein
MGFRRRHIGRGQPAAAGGNRPSHRGVHARHRHQPRILREPMPTGRDRRSRPGADLGHAASPGSRHGDGKVWRALRRRAVGFSGLVQSGGCLHSFLLCRRGPGHCCSSVESLRARAQHTSVRPGPRARAE